jgi:hypothetical protein
MARLAPTKPGSVRRRCGGEARDLAAQAALLEGALEREQQLVGAERLGQVVVGAGLDQLMAESMAPNAVMMMTLSSGRCAHVSASSSWPRMPGMMRSVTTASAAPPPLR